MSYLTVVLCNYNHARFLPYSLGGLLNQIRPADELIVIDDASTDNSVDVITRLLGRHRNARLVRNPNNIGNVATMNRGLSLAQGDIICYAAADDVIYPSLFAIGMSLLEQYSEAALFSARWEMIDEAGRQCGALPIPMPRREAGFVSPSAVARQLMYDDGWFMGSTLYRKAPLLAAGGFSEALYSFADSYASMALALRHGACFSPEILGGWRRMDGGMAMSRLVDIEKARQQASLVAQKMKEESALFPDGYAERWRRRYLFGAHRFALSQASRRAKARGRAAYYLSRQGEMVRTAWLFLRLRPWDAMAVLSRRLAHRWRP